MFDVSRWVSLIALVLTLSGCAGTAALPQKAIDLNDTGAQALTDGDLESAAARLEVALEYSPKFVDALVNLGLVELQRGNFTRARVLLERARRINPDVAQPHHALGVLAERERRPDRASEHYLAALRVDPGFAPARANLGRLQFDAGQLEAAALTFKKLIEVAPAEVTGYVGLIETFLRLQRFAEAEALTAKARDQFAGEPALELAAARIDLHSARFAAARATLISLSARRDDFGAAALGWLATLELAENRPSAALDAAQRALALDADQPVALLALSEAFTALGDARAAPLRERAERVAAGARSQ